MTCCWCDKRIPILRAIADSKYCSDEHREYATRTRVLNISEDGIAFHLPEATMPLLVRFRSERYNVQGVGAVKQCRRTGDKYVVGLEFTDGLRWRAPEEDVAEPIQLCEPSA
jgi:hypothetical protein